MGPPGSGKTRLARELSGTLSIPAIYLDREFFLHGFIKPDSDMWRETARNFANEERWIMDGNYFDVIEHRLLRADTLVILDMPLHKCVFRAYVRTFSHIGNIRDDLGQEERIRLSHLFNILTYRCRKWQRIERVIEIARCNKKAVFLLKSDGQIASFVCLVKKQEDMALFGEILKPNLR